MLFAINTFSDVFSLCENRSLSIITTGKKVPRLKVVKKSKNRCWVAWLRFLFTYSTASVCSGFLQAARNLITQRRKVHALFCESCNAISQKKRLRQAYLYKVRKKSNFFPSPALPFMIIGCRAIFRALGHQVLLYATIKDHLHDIISRGLCN